MDVRTAKERLKAKYADCGWFRGVGIVPSHDGRSLDLRLNVDPETRPPDLPDEFEGYRVEIVEVRAFTPRSPG